MIAYLATLLLGTLIGALARQIARSLHRPILRSLSAAQLRHMTSAQAILYLDGRPWQAPYYDPDAVTRKLEN